MRKYALVDDNIVTALEDFEESEYAQKVRDHSAVVDVEDMPVRPEIGWVLAGNSFSPPSGGLTMEESCEIQQRAQRIFGQKLATDAVDWLGARNLQFSRSGTTVDVAALAGQLGSLKALLDGGALKTARGLSFLAKTSVPAYADIFDKVIAEISNFLQTNGFE